MLTLFLFQNKMPLEEFKNKFGYVCGLNYPCKSPTIVRGKDRVTTFGSWLSNSFIFRQIQFIVAWERIYPLKAFSKHLSRSNINLFLNI